MAASHRVAQSIVGSYDACRSGGDCPAVVPDQFPAGLRVLVVDDDITCLKIIEQMLRRCFYRVTPCSQATVALNLLREKKGCFDVVLSDVHMPDMDGYKLLEHVGLEMDLPVIMMSADGRTSAVMKGIRHGACDYLIKPIREEELKNIWQHVVRKKWIENKELENSGSLEDNDRQKRGSDDSAVEYASSANEGAEGILKAQKRRNNVNEDECELENDDPSASKKPRVVWSVELHQQFVTAVNQLGLDKAVPKRILELMNVPGLTRENVASHLQKFRLYLKRLSGVAQQQIGIPNPYCGLAESNIELSSLGIHALASSGQIPPQTLAALHAELLGRPAGDLVMPAMDQPEHCVAFGQPSVKCQSKISKHYSQSIVMGEDVSTGYGAWPSNNLSTIGPNNNLGGMGPQSNNILMDILQPQQQEKQLQQQLHQQSILPESGCSINVQPSCLVVPSQSPASFHAVNSPVSINQNSGYNSTVIDYSRASPQSNNSSLSNGKFSGGDLKNMSMLGGYSAPGSISPTSSCSLNADSNVRQVQNSTLSFTEVRQFPGVVSNLCNIQGSYGSKSGQKSFRNLSFVGKETSVPSQFAGNEFEEPMINLIQRKVYMDNNKVKQEPSMDFIENAKVGPKSHQFSSSDLMSVFTK